MSVPAIPTNRQPGQIISSDDINDIAAAINGLRAHSGTATVTDNDNGTATVKEPPGIIGGSE